MTEEQRAKKRERDRRYHSSEKGRERDKRFYAKKREAHLCTRCGVRPLSPWSTWRCDPCLEKHAARLRDRYYHEQDENGLSYRLKQSMRQYFWRNSPSKLQDRREAAVAAYDAIVAEYEASMRKWFGGEVPACFRLPEDDFTRSLSKFRPQS